MPCRVFSALSSTTCCRSASSSSENKDDDGRCTPWYGCRQGFSDAELLYVWVLLSLNCDWVSSAASECRYIAGSKDEGNEGMVDGGSGGWTCSGGDGEGDEGIGRSGICH